MFDSNRVFKKTPNKSVYDFMIDKIFLRLPILENMVDSMDVTCEDPSQEAIFKSHLKTALGKIRSVFVQTGLSKSKDFSDIYKSFFGGKSNFVKQGLKFNFRKLEDVFGYLDLENGSIHIDNTNVSSKESTVTTIIHELMHYFTVMHEIKVYEGDKKALKFFDPVLFKSTFLLEGYTELLSQMMFPTKNKNRSYKKETGIVELLLFVSGKEYDFTDFLRMNLTQERKFLGSLEFDIFASKCKDYQDLHTNSKNDPNAHEKLSELYQDIQTILIDKYIHNLIDEYKDKKDFTNFTNKMSKLLEFIPDLNDSHVEKILDVENFLFKDEWNNNKEVYNLLAKYIKSKAVNTGKSYDFTYEGVQMYFTNNKEDGINLQINQIEFDENSLSKTYGKDGERFYIEGSKVSMLKTTDEGFKWYVTDKVNDKIVVEKGINIDYHETDEGDPYFSIYNILNPNVPPKLVMIDAIDESEHMEQNINFIQNLNPMTRIGKKFGIDYCKNIHKISSDDRKASLLEDKEIYIMDATDEEKYFFLKDKQGRLQQLYIENILTEKKGKYALFTPILSTLDGKINFNLIKNKDNVKSFNIYVLDNGMEVGEVVTSDGEVKRVIINGKYMVEQNANSLYDENNKDLKKAWESLLLDESQR